MSGKLNDPEMVDRYLRYLSISPLDLLEIDMHTKHYELGIPRFISEWHTRWIQLHEDEARELYGDEHVDARLAGWPVDATTTRRWPTRPTTAPAGLARMPASVSVEITWCS